VHITVRVRKGLPSLRGSVLASLVLKCFEAGNERAGFRLVHFSLQTTHWHLICEADGTAALSAAIKGLNVRIAKVINKRLGLKGPVTEDRYHLEVLRSPTQVRNAVRYVPNVLGTNQASFQPERPQSYLEEFTFRFNRRIRLGDEGARDGRVVEVEGLAPDVRSAVVARSEDAALVDVAKANLVLVLDLALGRLVRRIEGQGIRVGARPDRALVRPRAGRTILVDAAGATIDELELQDEDPYLGAVALPMGASVGRWLADDLERRPGRRRACVADHVAATLAPSTCTGSSQGVVRPRRLLVLERIGRAHGQSTGLSSLAARSPGPRPGNQTSRSICCAACDGGAMRMSASM